MKISILKTFLLSFFLLSSLSLVWAEEKGVEEVQIEAITLEQAVTRALANSPDLESASFDIKIVEARLSESRRASFLPSVKLRVLGGPVPDVPDGSGPPVFPDVDVGFWDLGPFFQLRLEAIQPIYTFGKLSNLKKAAEKGVRAKESQKEAARNEVVYRVKKVYFALDYLENLESFIRELEDRTRKARKRVEELIQENNPEVTDIDLMRFDVFSSEIERRATQLKHGIKLTETTLGILTGGVKGSPKTIIRRKLRPNEIPIQTIDHYLTRARQTRPEISQLRYGVAIRQALMKAAKADFFPLFFLGGFYGYGVAPGREDLDNPFLSDRFNINSGGVSFGLEQNLSFHMTESKYRKAKSEYLKALADQKRALLGIELEIRKAHSDAVSKKETVEIARKAFKAGRSWVTASTLNFGVGLTPVKDLLEAIVAYTQVKIKFYETQHDFHKGLSELSKVVGEEVLPDLFY